MKKTCSTLAVVAATALALSACGSAPTDSATTAAGTGGSGSDFKACMVSDEGGFDDQSFNQSGKEGLDRAAADLGVKVTAVESTSDADYPTNVDSLVQEQCDLIIGVGFKLADSITAAAKANPGINFALVDSTFTEEGLPNAKPLIFNTAEAAYLAGYAAAGTTKTGTVATYGGMAIPTVQIFMEGFAQGVAKHNTDKGTSVKVLGWDPAAPESGSFVGDFSSTTKGQQLTEQFLSQGADIILPVAGPVGLGTLSAVEAKGSADTGVIWVDADGYNTTDGGKHMVTSVVKEIGVAVYDTVKEASQGSFTSTPFVGTLENDGVALAGFHDWDAKVPATTKTEIEALKKQIIDGSLDVSTAYDPS